MKPRKLKKRGLIDTVLKRDPPVNAAIEVWNVVAEQKYGKASSTDTTLIHKIKEKYRNDHNIIFSHHKIQKEGRRMLKDYASFLVNKAHKFDIRKEFSCLSSFLEISKPQSKVIFEDLASITMTQWWENTIRRYKFNIFDNMSEIKKLNEKILNNLGVRTNFDRKIYESVKNSIFLEEFDRFISEIIESERLSPQIKKSMKNLEHGMGCKYDYSQSLKFDLKLFEELWYLEYKPLKAIRVPINLQRGEEAYYSCRVCLQEWKKVRTSSGTYSGSGFSVPVGGGIRAYAGSGGRGSATYLEGFHDICDGDLYISNKRLIFKGSVKAISLRWSQILDLEFTDEGIRVIKSSGKPLNLGGGPGNFTFGDSERIYIIYRRIIDLPVLSTGLLFDNN